MLAIVDGQNKAAIQCARNVARPILHGKIDLAAIPFRQRQIKTREPLRYTWCGWLVEYFGETTANNGNEDFLDLAILNGDSVHREVID